MISEGLQARVSGVGMVAPGINGWEEAAAILSGRRTWQPAPLTIPATEFLPVAERRRVGKAVRLALGCGHEAVAASGLVPADIASVFASADVDAENTHQICIALNDPRPSLSPTRFHNSVQNAVSGYWTILTGSQAPTTMVMGGDEILALGLLEAMSQAAEALRPVLLVVFDLPMPAPLFATHPIEGGGALALVLDARAGGGPTMRVQLLRRAEAAPPAEPAVALPAGLAALRRVHPVGTALSMLAQLACAPGTVPKLRPTQLDLDSYHSLRISIEP